MITIEIKILNYNSNFTIQTDPNIIFNWIE